MALNKVTYQDLVTVIAALNLNDIQDEIIANAQAILNSANAIGTLANLTTTAKNNLVAAINEVDANADTQDAKLKLLCDEIPNTVQTYTFSGGSVSQVLHKSGSTTIRTDTFTYGTNTITETRTLNTGEVLTIATNLTTLETTVTYTE